MPLCILQPRHTWIVRLITLKNSSPQTLLVPIVFWNVFGHIFSACQVRKKKLSDSTLFLQTKFTEVCKIMHFPPKPILSIPILHMQVARQLRSISSVHGTKHMVYQLSQPTVQIISAPFSFQRN